MGYKMPRRLPTNPLQIYQPANLCLVIDGDSCLDRLYGGYYNDWVCGGQWNRVVEYLGQFIASMAQHNIEAVVYFNGALEKDRIKSWTAGEVEKRKRASEAMRHIELRQTPPAKAFWVPPAGLRACLRLALRHLNIPVMQSLEDHQQEVIGFLRENGFDAICAEGFEYCFFDPPRIFSSHGIKLTSRGGLLTTEFVTDEMARKLNLHPDRLCVLAAMMGSHILPAEELRNFYDDLLTNTSAKQKNDYSVIIPAIVAFLRSLPVCVDDLDGIGLFVFRNVADVAQRQAQADRFVRSVRYFMNGTKAHYHKFFQPLNKLPLQSPSFNASHMPTLLPAQVPKPNGALPNGYAISPPNIQPKPLSGTASKFPFSQNLLSTAVVRHSSCLMHPWIYQVLSSGEIKLESFLEDPSLTNLPYGWFIFRPMRQSVYAVLFNVNHTIVSAKLERDGSCANGSSRSANSTGSSNNRSKTSGTENQCQSVQPSSSSESAPGKYPSATIPQQLPPPSFATRVVREWVYLPKRASYEQESVHAVPVDWRGMPTVERLWLGQKQEDKTKRLKAFLVCMNSDVPQMLDAQRVPQHLLLLCCVLRYLVVYNEKPILQPQELDALLAQALSPKLRDSAYLQTLKATGLTPRCVQLAQIVMQGVDHALFVNDACGSPIPLLMCQPWLYFHGRLFQQKLQAVQKGNLLSLCDNEAALAVQVERAREAILQDIRMPFCRSMAAIPVWALHNIGPHAIRPPTQLLGPQQFSSGGRANGAAGPSGGGKLEVAGVVVGQWGANETSKKSGVNTRDNWRLKNGNCPNGTQKGHYAKATTVSQFSRSTSFRGGRTRWSVGSRPGGSHRWQSNAKKANGNASSIVSEKSNAEDKEKDEKSNIEVKDEKSNIEDKDEKSPKPEEEASNDNDIHSTEKPVSNA